MSRLSSYQQKQFRRKVTTYIIFIVLLIFFMFTIGFRLVIGAAVFVSNLSASKKAAPLEKKDFFYGSLNVDSIPQATNSARIIVAGSVTNYDIVEYYVNGEKVKENSFQASDSFSEEVGNLKPGQNEVYLKALTKDKDKSKTKESPKYTVLYKNDKPKLELGEPSDKTKTRNQDVKIAGHTDREVYVKVNELPIVVNSDGSFQTIFRLKDGDNTLLITAEDSAGNIESKTIMVTYQKDD